MPEAYYLVLLKLDALGGLHTRPDFGDLGNEQFHAILKAQDVLAAVPPPRADALPIDGAPPVLEDAMDDDDGPGGPPAPPPPPPLPIAYGG
eukprot:846270-Pyramimonas_sp.AAC.1